MKMSKKIQQFKRSFELYGAGACGQLLIGWGVTLRYDRPYTSAHFGGQKVMFDLHTALMFNGQEWLPLANHR